MGGPLRIFEGRNVDRLCELNPRPDFEEWGYCETQAVGHVKTKNTVGKPTPKITDLIGNFANWQQGRECHGVFLFDTEGSLVYTVFKEPGSASKGQIATVGTIQ